MSSWPRAAVPNGTTLHWPKKEEWYDRHDLTSTSAALRRLLAVNPTDSRIGSVLHWLMVHRTGEYWHCTRDTSVVLAALADYLVCGPPKPGNGDVKVSINGAPYRSVTLSAPHYKEPELIVRIPSSSLKSGKNEIKLERTAGSGTVFYSMQLRQTIASEDMAAAAPAGYTITREYLRIKPGHDSEYSWRMKTEPTNNRLQSGDRIRVRLTIDIPQDISYVLIEDPFPSGCEGTEKGSGTHR